MPQRGDKRQDKGSCRGDLYILMGRCLRTEKKERCQSVREVLEALEKLEARIFANVIYHFSGLPQQAAGAESGLHIPHLARSDICGRKEFLPLQGAE